MRGGDKRRNSFLVLPVHFFCASVFQENFLFGFGGFSEPEEKPGCRKERGRKERRQERAENKKQDSEVLRMPDKFVGTGDNNGNFTRFSKLNNAGKEKPNARNHKENGGKAKIPERDYRKRITGKVKNWVENKKCDYKNNTCNQKFLRSVSRFSISVKGQSCDSSEKYPEKVNNIRKEDIQFRGNQKNKDYGNEDYYDYRVQFKNTTEKIMYYLLLVDEYFILFITVILSVYFNLYYSGNKTIVLLVMVLFIPLAYSWIKIRNWYGKKKRWFKNSP